MKTRLERIGEFSRGEPPAGEALELLCEDTRGTYLIPSLCIWREGKWVTAERGTTIAVKVVGWRTPQAYKR